MASSQRLFILLCGTLLAVVSGFLSYLGAGRDTTLGIVVGLQVEILTLLVELLAMHERRSVWIGRSARLVARIERTPGLEALLDDLTTYLDTIQRRFAGTIAAAEAERLIGSCSAEIRDLSIGHLFRDSYDPSLKMELLRSTASTLRTTSLQTHDLAWHNSDVGHAYWAAQLNALERGWVIERIFIYQNWDSELDALARLQAKAGVHVRRISITRTPQDLQVDFTLWGEAHAYQQWIRRTQGLLEDRFSVEPTEIGTYKEMWRRLHALAEDLGTDALP